MRSSWTRVATKVLLLMAIVAMVTASSPRHHYRGPSSTVLTASRRLPYLSFSRLSSPIPPQNFRQVNTDRLYSGMTVLNSKRHIRDDEDAIDVSLQNAARKLLQSSSSVDDYEKSKKRLTEDQLPQPCYWSLVSCYKRRRRTDVDYLRLKKFRHAYGETELTTTSDSSDEQYDLLHSTSK